METCLEPRPSKVGATSYLGHLGEDSNLEAWRLVAWETKSPNRNHVSHRIGEFTIPRESTILQDFSEEMKAWEF